ncbi:MAG: hypothetical protein M0D57_09190 [Sphingobacteriales bacterium JAD_PAG50586_3]|nr:MAG: hypothetical protein M0D57_09190 [Sphingobacteriales bacterium JAD_PAG50586_3]
MKGCLQFILWAIASVVLVVIVVVIGFISYIGYYKLTRIDFKETAESAEFKTLLNQTANLDTSIHNISILTEEEYIVVNGLVINTKRNTFGYEPELGFYGDYYKQGDRTRYTQLDSLLKSQKIVLDSISLYSLLTQMKEMDVSDIAIKNKECFFKWKGSDINEGLLYSQRKLTKDSLNYKGLKLISNNVYYFSR